MKKIIFLILMALAMFACNSNKQEPVVKSPEIQKIDPKVNVVFIVVGKNIDYDKMAIKDITKQIMTDSILSVKSVTPEINIDPQIIKVYRVEDITCPYLKEKFKNKIDGELVYEYRDNILVKLKDGVIKVYHSHIKR